MRLWRSILLIGVVGLAGCGGDGDKNPVDGGSSTTIKKRSPEDARRELGELGVQFDRESFIKSVENEDLLAIQLFIDAGMDPNTKNEDREPALVWAAENDKVAVVQVLLDKGADIEAKDNDGFTALRIAAKSGHADIVALLLKKGADVNEKDEEGETVLMAAARAGQTEAIRVLLDHKADVAIRNGQGETALMVAIWYDFTDGARLLLEAGANAKYRKFKIWNQRCSGVQAEAVERVWVEVWAYSRVAGAVWVSALVPGRPYLDV